MHAYKCNIEPFTNYSATRGRQLRKVKYCNHLLAVDMAVDMACVACRGLWCACGWKNVHRYRVGSP